MSDVATAARGLDVTYHLATAPLPRPTAWAWTSLRPWACPRCGAVIETVEAGPRGLGCGFVEGT